MPRKDGTDTKREAAFRFLVNSLLVKGIKPTPTEIQKWQEAMGFKFVYPATGHSGPSFTGGILVAIRREEFLRAGWTYEPHGGVNKRWMPPQS